MAKKVTRSRPWTKEELRMLKTLTREKTKTVIAQNLKWSVDAMYGLATKLGVIRGETDLRCQPTLLRRLRAVASSWRIPSRACAAPSHGHPETEE
jgi:hypothetical protein